MNFNLKFKGKASLKLGKFRIMFAVLFKNTKSSFFSATQCGRCRHHKPTVERRMGGRGCEEPHMETSAGVTQTNLCSME